MWNAAAVLACALSALGRPEASMPPIQLVDVLPASVSSRAQAYVFHGDSTIYLVTSAATFREAMTAGDRCDDSLGVKKLAGILAHEEWHVRNGFDEKGAYAHQLVTLMRMGIGPTSQTFRDVQLAMSFVMGNRRRDPPGNPSEIARETTAAPPSI